jgi:hypothetical protein
VLPTWFAKKSVRHCLALGLYFHLVACGGEAGTAVPAGGNGGSAAGGAASGGQAANAGAATTGGAASTTVPCEAASLAPVCASTCLSEAYEVLEPECAAASWRCPAGSTATSACPQDSCAAPSTPCCDPATGERTWPACGADGFREACVEGSERRAGDCIAADLGVTKCDMLMGKSCTQSGRACHSGGREGTICTCEEQDDGALRWFCATLI